MGQGHWNEKRTGRARLGQAERGKDNKTKERERGARQEEGERKGKHNYLIVQYLLPPQIQSCRVGRHCCNDLTKLFHKLPIKHY